jgi:hypothetical protein
MTQIIEARINGNLISALNAIARIKGAKISKITETTVLTVAVKCSKKSEDAVWAALETIKGIEADSMLTVY